MNIFDLTNFISRKRKIDTYFLLLALKIIAFRSALVINRLYLGEIEKSSPYQERQALSTSLGSRKLDYRHLFVIAKINSKFRIFRKKQKDNTFCENVTTDISIYEKLEIIKPI
jgi:hypothetical protein